MQSVEMWLAISIISCILMFTMMFFFKFNELNVNSNEPFECGMEPITNNRMPFLMQFYMVAILFLIFDIEFVITLPLVISMINYKHWSITMLIITNILILGLAVEIHIGTLEWKS